MGQSDQKRDLQMQLRSMTSFHCNSERTRSHPSNIIICRIPQMWIQLKKCIGMHWCCWHNSRGAVRRLLGTLGQLLLQKRPAVKELWSHQETLARHHPSLKKDHFAIQRKESTVQISPVQEKIPHCRHNWMEWPQTPGIWKFCLALLHLYKDGIAERLCRRYGLQEGASMKSGCSTGREGKCTFRKTTTNWFSSRVDYV